VISYNLTKTDARNWNLFTCKHLLRNLKPDFVRLPQWVIHHTIHIYKGFQQWSATISVKQMLQQNKMQLVYMQKLTSKFAAGLRPAPTVSHTSCDSHFWRVSTVISYNLTKTDARNCNLFICKNLLQNSPPDFIRLLLWVIHHAIHIYKGFQQRSATISPKQMLEIATCLYAKIYFKIRRRTSSGCHSES
jgi:hypothetical protein